MNKNWGKNCHHCNDHTMVFNTIAYLLAFFLSADILRT